MSHETDERLCGLITISTKKKCKCNLNIKI